MSLCMYSWYMGYWPSVRSRWLDIGQVLFLRVYGPRQSRGQWTRKKRTRPISSHLDRSNLVNKGFIIWLLGKFFLLETAGSPERVRWLHLAHLDSQSHRAIWFILPAWGASHIISILNALLWGGQIGEHEGSSQNISTQTGLGLDID